MNIIECVPARVFIFFIPEIKITDPILPRALAAKEGEKKKKRAIEPPRLDKSFKPNLKIYIYVKALIRELIALAKCSSLQHTFPFLPRCVLSLSRTPVEEEEEEEAICSPRWTVCFRSIASEGHFSGCFYPRKFSPPLRSFYAISISFSGYDGPSIFLRTAYVFENFHWLTSSFFNIDFR